MTWAPHDFSIDIGIHKLCSRCGRSDLVANRRKPCHPLPPGEIEAKIRRMAVMARRFRGTPSTTSRPVTVNKRRARLPI